MKENLLYNEQELFVLEHLSSITPDMRDAKEQEPFIIIEMAAIAMSTETGQKWNVKKVLTVLLPILFRLGDECLL